MVVIYFVHGKTGSHNIYMLGHHSLDGQTRRWVLFNTIISDLKQAVTTSILQTTLDLGEQF